MDALLPPFVAAFLAEWGDRTQLLACLLAVRFGAPRAALAGIALAALANSLLAAFGGYLLADYINFRAITLMMALALLFAGAGALWPQRPPKLAGSGKAGALLTSLFAFGMLEFGDKTQFITATLAARTGSLWLTALAATGGIILATLPAVLLADRLSATVPLKAIRIGVALLFFLLGAIAAITALRIA